MRDAWSRSVERKWRRLGHLFNAAGEMLSTLGMYGTARDGLKRSPLLHDIA